jgi:hypothetical protein
VSGIPAWSSSVGDAHYDDPADRNHRSRGTCAWQNGRTLHRQTQKFEPPLLQDQSFEAEQNPGGKGTKRKSQNKMNKSFLLSGGRKNDRFGSGFKPVTLPDSQNGNVTLLSVLNIRREIWRILPGSNSLERSFQAFINDVRFPKLFTLFLR